MEKPTVFKVFYSWQSDTPQSHCRHLIGEALENAADKLGRDESIPYRVEIDRDTLNETGLCDIPATILAKIDAADAVVADLTYIARTEPDNGVSKSCSNPNVLFELGYAFRSIGHDRLICVMNEAHGPRSEQIFDLHHRRRPVAFTSPKPGTTRAQTIAELAKELVDVLRPIVLKHGPQSISGDGSTRHASDRAQIESIVSSVQGDRNRLATITCYASPRLYQDRRWPNREALVAAINKRTIQVGLVQWPLRVNKARGMEWGIFCDTGSSRHDRWAMTYAGQFWSNFSLPSVTDQGIYVDPSRPSIAPDPPFIDAYEMIYCLCRCFAFLSSLANEFHKGESLEVAVRGDNFKGRSLGSKQWPRFEGTPPSISLGFYRRFTTSASELASDWLSYCGETAMEACGIFTNAVDSIPREAINQMLQTANKQLSIPPN